VALLRESVTSRVDDDEEFGDEDNGTTSQLWLPALARRGLMHAASARTPQTGDGDGE